MADRLIRTETLADIAEAIRIKTDSENAMSPGQMRALILQTRFGNVPAHHDAQALDLIQRLRTLRDAGGNYLVFGAMADSHVSTGTEYEALSKTSARHAAFALETVGRWGGCDFLADLGDSCWNGDLDAPLDAASAEYLSGCIAAGFASLPSCRLVGEYDRGADAQAVYDRIGAYNTFDAGSSRGFGYRDYPDQKVRVIALNTSDCCGTAAGYGMSYEQKDFLLRALDLSAKADWEQWQILLLSHYPLDYPGDVRYNTAAHVKSILNAYVNGNSILLSVDSDFAAAEGEDPTTLTTYRGGYLVYNYKNINTPTIIGNFHGHVHNASFGTMEGHLVPRIATPNACFYLENGSLDDLYTVDSAQPKTAGTAEDTAVCFYAVDLDHHMIHSLAFGAGEDREIAY